MTLQIQNCIRQFLDKHSMIHMLGAMSKMILLLHMTLIINRGCNMNLWIILPLGWVDIKQLLFIMDTRFFVHVIMAKMKVGKLSPLSWLCMYDFGVISPSGLWLYHSWLTKKNTLQKSIIHLHGLHQSMISSGNLLISPLRPLIFQVHTYTYFNEEV